MIDIPGYKDFKKIEPINKGFSNDKKYYIENADGRRLLLRVTDIVEYDRKKAEYEMMERVSALGIPMSHPVDFGTCCGNKNVYQLLTWCDGEDLETALPTLTEGEQYALGLKAGEILKKIHTVETFPPSSDWAKKHGKVIDRYIEEYKNCGMTFDGDKVCMDYIERNRNLIENRPMCLTHGDFHAGNLIISREKELSVIDFNRYNIGDPYAAFRGIMFSAAKSPRFAAGQIRGYFGGNPPADFWDLLAFYLAALNIHALPWSIPLGQDSIDFGYKMIKNVLSWFDNFQNPVPTWYLNGRRV